MLYRFHANLFAMPEGLKSSETVELRGAARPVLGRDNAPPTFDGYFATTFEQVLEALSKLPRIDAEPDGFFVMSGDVEGRRWQLDGHLFDFGGRLHRMELHGDCPQETLDAILSTLGWPATPIAFELVQEGVALGESTFREWASVSP